nr:MAG TPA: hypothetical protein [Caudoviricetes sp.]
MKKPPFRTVVNKKIDFWYIVWYFCIRNCFGGM